VLAAGSRFKVQSSRFKVQSSRFKVYSLLTTHNSLLALCPLLSALSQAPAKAMACKACTLCPELYSYLGSSNLSRIYFTLFV